MEKNGTMTQVDDIKQEMDRRYRDGLIVTGQTYDCKDILSEHFGCLWDSDKSAWLAADETQLKRCQRLTDERYRLKMNGPSTDKQVNTLMDLTKKMWQNDAWYDMLNADEKPFSETDACCMSFGEAHRWIGRMLEEVKRNG